MKKNRFYRFARIVLGFIFKIYYHPKVIGKDNILKDGPIIIAGNHKHVMDQCGIIISTKREIHYMAKKEYFDSKYAWFFRKTGCISVDRSIHDNDAKEKALDVLRNGRALGIFPEGTRNKTKEFLLPFKFGCVSMAEKTDAFIIPFSVTGDYKFRSKNLVYRIGKPFKVGKRSLEDANKKLEKEIGNLMKLSLKEDKK